MPWKKAGVLLVKSIPPRERDKMQATLRRERRDGNKESNQRKGRCMEVRGEHGQERQRTLGE